METTTHTIRFNVRDKAIQDAKEVIDEIINRELTLAERVSCFRALEEFSRSARFAAKEELDAVRGIKRHYSKRP